MSWSLSKHGIKLVYALITRAKWNNSLSLPGIIAVTNDTTYSYYSWTKAAEWNNIDFKSATKMRVTLYVLRTT